MYGQPTTAALFDHISIYRPLDIRNTLPMGIEYSRISFNAWFKQDELSLTP